MSAGESRVARSGSSDRCRVGADSVGVTREKYYLPPPRTLFSDGIAWRKWEGAGPRAVAASSWVTSSWIVALYAAVSVSSIIARSRAWRATSASSAEHRCTRSRFDLRDAALSSRSSRLFVRSSCCTCRL